MIKFAVVGYGNLGRACEKIAVNSQDIQIVGVFTRRDPETMSSPYGTKFYRQDDLENFKDKIDVLALCTGSANDLTSLGLKMAKSFNTVDSFDTHAKMFEYVTNMEKAATESGHLSFVGIGWDPGLFSLMRTVFQGVLPDGNTQTFWGKGVSQGHSEAIRKINGVLKGIQYTIPKENALELTRAGKGGNLTTREKHLRECFLVVAENADKTEIERQIKTMPNYFSDYDTVVHFITDEEFEKNHRGMPHGGFVMRSGISNETADSLEFSLKLDSNPDFTANVLMNFVRANVRMFAKGERGARTIVDIPMFELFSGTRQELLEHII